MHEAILAEDDRAVEEAARLGLTLQLQVHPFKADLLSPILEVPHTATIAFIKRRIHAGTRFVRRPLLLRTAAPPAACPARLRAPVAAGGTPRAQQRRECRQPPQVPGGSRWAHSRC